MLLKYRIYRKSDMGSIWDLPGVLEISLFMKHILNRQVSLYIVLFFYFCFAYYHVKNNCLDFM